MTLETIYSVGEGRTVVVAVDGCMGCFNAFEEFVRDKADPEDRIVAVVKGGKAKLPEGKFSGPLLLSGTPRARAMAKSFLAGQRPSSPASPGLGPSPAEREDCKVRNRVIIPGKPLADFQDWDRTSKSILSKLAQRADDVKIRFEAIRVLAGSRPNLWVEAVMECCNELEADLLVVASHKQPKGPHARSLSAVFSVNTKCPVLVLGKKTPPEATVPPAEDEETDTQGKLRRTVSTFSKTLSMSGSFGPARKAGPGDFPEPRRRSGFPPSGKEASDKNRSRHQRQASDDSDLPAETYGKSREKHHQSGPSRPSSSAARRVSFGSGRMQENKPSRFAQKVREVCLKGSSLSLWQQK